MYAVSSVGGVVDQRIDDLQKNLAQTRTLCVLEFIDQTVEPIPRIFPNLHNIHKSQPARHFKGLLTLSKFGL